MADSRNRPQTLDEMREMATELPFSASLLICQYEQVGKDEPAPIDPNNQVICFRVFDNSKHREIEK